MKIRISQGVALASLFAIPVLDTMGQDAAATAEAPATEAAETSGDAGITEEQIKAGVIATVDGREIMRSDVDRRVVGRYSRQLEELPADQQEFMRMRVEQVAIDELIDRALLANAATKAEGHQPTEEAVNERFEQMKGQLPPGADLTAALDQLGLTEASLREEVRVELAINSLLEERMASVEQPTAEEAKQFYDENQDFFTKGAVASARHILVSTQGIVDTAQIEAKMAEAEALRARLVGDDAEPFADVATAHSDCPSSSQGGMLGEFEKGRMVPEFEAAAFSQEIGEVGPLVKTDFGFHIILVEERTEGGVAPFEEVADTLPSYLGRQRQEEAVKNYVRELRDQADIKRAM